MRKYLAAASALLLLFVQGCVSVNKQAFNQAAHREIREIVLLEPKSWDDYEAVVMNHAAAGFGLIGGLIIAAEISTKSNTLTKSLQPFNWQVSQALSAQLESDLKAAGYSVKRLPVVRDVSLLKDYKAIRPLDSANDVGQPHAWLDVAIQKPAYVANSHAANYVPSLRVFVRLVTADKQLIVYEEQIFYGHSFPSGVSLKADSTYSFANMDALTAKPDVTMEGLREGVRQVSLRIASDLRHADRAAAIPTAAATTVAPATTESATVQAAPAVR